jgi:hypothetical protein
MCLLIYIHKGDHGAYKNRLPRYQNNHAMGVGYDGTGSSGQGNSTSEGSYGYDQKYRYQVHIFSSFMKGTDDYLYNLYIYIYINICIHIYIHMFISLYLYVYGHAPMYVRTYM